MNARSTSFCKYALSALTGLAIFVALAATLPADASDNERLFALEVRPLLSDKCFHCHGPDEAERPTDLRLDTQDGIVEAFAGGDFEQSEAWRRISSADPDEVMPPVDMHKPFNAEELALIRKWMAGGAVWSPHWAFVKPQKTRPPEGFADHPIDAFVQRRLAEAGAEPAPPAAKEKLLRRATLDLHGLPPTPEELDDFLADDSPEAWDRVLTRLMGSPRYGERMAVDWLDGARYADTNGYQNDFVRTMWPWRNWVIEAYNRNQPFDEFTIEQLAGDLLDEPTDAQRLATGFNRNHRTVTEAGSIEAEWMVENVVDRVETTSAVFLGLTMGCARCHDHKYDPITQEEFFEFFAFFHNINEKGFYNEIRNNAGPQIRYLNDEQRATLKRLAKETASARDHYEGLRPDAEQAAKRWLGETEKPYARPVPDLAFPMDAEGFPGVAEGERVLKQLEVTRFLPARGDSFLGKVADFRGGGAVLDYGQVFQPRSDRPLSVSVWIKLLGRGGAMWGKMDTKGGLKGIDGFVDNEGRVSLELVHQAPDNQIKVTTKTALPKRQWEHVTITYDGSGRAEGVRIFFGDRPQETDVQKDQLTGTIATEAPFRLGKRARWQALRAEMARLRVYKRELQAEDIASLIRSDLIGAAGGLEEGEKPHADLVIQQAKFAGGEAGEAYAAAERRWLDAKFHEQTTDKNMPTSMVMEELPEPRDTYVLIRGEYDKPDKDRKVTAATPDFLGSLPTERNDRRALAEWIVSRDNPLTARVIVNRLWARLFGVGLVKTEENLGVQCEPPSHPDLLDWLAVEFIDSGWDVQRMLRLMMTSEAYQRSSNASPQAYQDDPENRLLARGPRRRLQAEFVRDNALAVSGLLVGRIGGPSVMPYQPEGLWSELAGGSPQKYVLAKGEDLYRRSLYTYRKRTVPHPTMTTFDAPSFEICTVSRSRTNTPLQALALLNDVTYVEAARKLGERMLARSEGDAERLRYGFRLATSRSPSDEELTILLGALDRRRGEYRDNPEAAQQLLAAGASGHAEGADPIDLAAYAMVGNLLLNLDETITVE